MPPQVIRRFISRGVGRLSADGDKVYLTYDDGPDPEVTPPLLEILAKAGAQATFFVVASQAPWWAELIRKIAEGGHAIGLHGLHHRSNFLRGNGNIHRDLKKLADMISLAGVSHLNLYRPPFGHVRPDTVSYLKRRGIETVLWSSIPGDFRLQPAENLLNRALRDLRPGAIYALHDGVRHRPAPVLELTKQLLEQIHSRGWQTAYLKDVL